MKRNGFTLWEFLAILVVIVILAAVFWPAFSGAKNPHRAQCQSNLKQIGLAFMMYNQDNKGRLPLIRVNTVAESRAPYDNPFGWADAIYPYLKKTDLFQCSKDELPINAQQDAVLGRFTDYYYNSNLAGVWSESISILPQTFLLGEGNDGMDGSDARYNRNVLTRAWREDEKSPARRHLDGANYAFADGHVKWLQPEKVKTVRSKDDDYSFTVK